MTTSSMSYDVRRQPGTAPLTNMSVFRLGAESRPTLLVRAGTLQAQVLQRLPQAPGRIPVDEMRE